MCEVRGGEECGMYPRRPPLSRRPPRGCQYPLPLQPPTPRAHVRGKLTSGFSPSPRECTHTLLRPRTIHYAARRTPPRHVIIVSPEHKINIHSSPASCSQQPVHLQGRGGDNSASLSRGIHEFEVVKLGLANLITEATSPLVTLRLLR